MKKKFLALVLTLAMVLSLVPVTALATNGTPTPDKATESVTTSQDGVNITKKVVTDKEGNHNLVMEAYVEGTTETTISTKPLDIVLVLDVSGSMDGPMGNRDNTKRIDALKSAVNTFIDKVAEKNTSTDGTAVGHRISIVKFAGNKSTEIGDDTYTEESGIWPFIETNTYNYSQIVKNLTAVNDAGKVALKTAVKALQPAGATRADYGMELAKKELENNSKDQSRDKVVVMFTDGSPNSSNGFEYDVASDAISASKALKDKDVKVYTIGIFSGANPKEEVTKNKTSAENKYMHAVSSNYPHATLDWKQTGYFSGEWQWNFGTRAKGSNYYLSAKNSTELKNVFQTISNSITTTHVTANENAVLRDTLTERFVLNGDANKITVQTAAVTGKDKDGKYTWGEPASVDVEKAIDGKTVTVKGFNYTSEDNVITENNGKYSGHKLIVTIPIKVNEAYEGWEAGTKNYDTNVISTEEKQAGLTGYTKGTDTNASTLLEQSPQVPVPTYQVIYDWGTSGVTTLVTDSRYYISGQNATVDYTTVKKGDAVKGSNDQLYRFSGWSENGTDIVDTVEIKDRDVTLTPVLTEAYTVTYTDGVANEEVFADQVYSNLIKGDNTPSFSGTLTRDGYKFTGWEPTVAGIVTGNATYMAQWQKLVEGEVVVTITGKNDTVKYDGIEKSVSGYDVTITQNNDGDTTYTKDDFTFSGTAEAKGTDVKDGGYSMGLKVADFENKSSQFTNVTFVVVDGKLTIQPRAVTMTSGDATKPWDDTALTNDTVTVTGDGFVEGEGANYTVTGSQTDVGESDNTFTYALKDGTTASNYDITTEFGKLTITEKAEVPYTLIFNANDGAWDSEEISGYALNTEKNQATKSGLAASYRVDTSTVTEPKKENATFLGWGTTEGILPNLILKPTVAALKHQLGGDGNTVTLYAVWKTEETTDPAGNCTYTIRQHYWKNLNDNDTDTGDNVSIKNLTAKSDEKIASLIDGKDKDQDWRGYRYLYDNQQTMVTVPGQEPTKLTKDAVLSVSGTVIDLYYYLDSWKDGNTQDSAGKDEKTGGDGTPDYKQILIEYKAHTPLVGEVSREFEIQTLKDNQTVATPTGAIAKAKKDSVYAFAYWIKGEVDPEKTEAEIENTAICYKNQLSGVTINPVTRGGTYTYTAIFLEDKLGGGDNKDQPDGIPDAWQYKVTFKVANGKWNDQTSADVVAYVTNKKDGTPCAKGTEGSKATLDGVTIPVAGSQPDSGYRASGNWDTTPSATTVINKEDTVFTYTYDQKSGGSGGSGGSHKPTVTIPDDVPTGLNGKDHYAYVVGYPDGMVYPQKNITRAEVATIFFRLLTDETREANMTKSNGYNDMKDGAWYTCAVSTLSKMGIIKGYEDGSFKPDASISRAEFAAIAARFDPDGDKTPATFSDVSSHWAKDEISIAANHGWIKGYEDGSFKPDQKITRAETMTLVNRVLKRLPETKDDLHKDMKTWPDNQNESAWFYLAVQEATNSHYQKLKKDGTHETWESMRETRDWAALEK